MKYWNSTHCRRGVIIANQATHARVMYKHVWNSIVVCSCCVSHGCENRSEHVKIVSFLRCSQLSVWRNKHVCARESKHDGDSRLEHSCCSLGVSIVSYSVGLGVMSDAPRWASEGGRRFRQTCWQSRIKLLKHSSSQSGLVLFLFWVAWDHRLYIKMDLSSLHPVVQKSS